MTRVEELTLDLADDVLTHAGNRELQALLAEDPQSRSAYIRILQIEAGLRAQRQHEELTQHVMARLRREVAEESVARGVMAQIKTQPSPEWRREQVSGQDIAGSRASILPFPFNARLRRSFGRAWLPLAACFILLAGIGFWLFGPTIGKPVLSEVTGPNVSIQREGKLISAAVGTGLRDGDILRTSEGSSAVIRFAPEETRITLLPGTEFRLTSFSRSKRFDLEMGKLEASVARQRPFRPMILRTPQAEARVIGTRFTLTVTTNSTRLDVTEGLVRFTRLSDEQFVRVGAEQWQIAATNYELRYPLPSTGILLREYWTNVPGGFWAVHLTANTNYPNYPSGRDYLSKLETFSNWGTNYGARIRGYLLPPATGEYTFWITAGDGADLYLSLDGNPDHRQQIAHWEGPKGNTQQSSPLPLTAGYKYYLEVLQKTGTTNSHLTVEWQGPGRKREVIPGEFLSPWKLK